MRNGLKYSKDVGWGPAKTHAWMLYEAFQYIFGVIFNSKRPRVKTWGLLRFCSSIRAAWAGLLQFKPRRRARRIRLARSMPSSRAAGDHLCWWRARVWLISCFW